MNDGGNEINRAQQRRGDQEDHADEPEGLAVGRNGCGQRRIRGPARLRGAPFDKEANEHDQPADDVSLIAGHVDARKGHIRRPDLQGDDEIAKGGKGRWHDRHEHHNGPVHCAERIVQVGRNYSFGGSVTEERRQ